MRVSRLIEILAQYIQEQGDIDVRLFVPDEAGGEYAFLDEMWLNVQVFRYRKALVISSRKEDMPYED